jgi:hypothetical protein
MHAFGKFMPFYFEFSIILISIDQLTALLKVSSSSHQILYTHDVTILEKISPTLSTLPK